MKNGHGFTIIEIVVVLVIVGILTGLLVYQFVGQTSKSNAETSIKQLYTDLSEMRIKAMSNKTAYGIYWGTIGPFDIVSYELRADAYNGTTVPNGSISDAGMGACTGTNGCSLLSTTTPVSTITILNTTTNVTFNDKGIYKNASTTVPEFYVKCNGCDTSSSCSNSNLSACRPADTSANCNDTSYPEYSCLVVNATFIKMGKWCDTNNNGAYDSGECSIR